MGLAPGSRGPTRDRSGFLMEPALTPGRRSRAWPQSGRGPQFLLEAVARLARPERSATAAMASKAGVRV